MTNLFSANKEESTTANKKPIGEFSFRQKNAQGTACRTITSEALFAGARELLIEHAGDNYRLRLTNQGKLILTK